MLSGWIFSITSLNQCSTQCSTQCAAETTKCGKYRYTEYDIWPTSKPDGSTSGDYPTMCFAVLIPALLTDDPSRGFVIGWGTGVSRLPR